MLLSFSIPEMLPYLVAGIHQAEGQDIGSLRVKRQTIRELKGPNSPWHRLLADPPHYVLHLWWKSRSPKRHKLGEVGCKSARAIQIRHRPNGRMTIDFYMPHAAVHHALYEGIAHADGFDTIDAFRDFFVPRPGDVFNGVLIKW